MPPAPPPAPTPSDYQLLDFAGRRRLEAWGPYRLVRPDVRAEGRPVLAPAEWDAAHAEYRGRVGRGQWVQHQPIPPSWTVEVDLLRFEVRCAPSMHLGLFPEQAEHWRWLRDATTGRPLEILNLFAYTGGASVALARLGHRVTHVAASRPSIAWARRNAAINDVETIRWIGDDARAFVRRERRRGRRYAGLLLDPPAFGRGPAGPWQVERDLPPLLDDAIALLVEDAAFVLLNLYGLDAEPDAAGRLLAGSLARAGHPLSRHPMETGWLALHTADGRALPTGVHARCAG